MKHFQSLRTGRCASSFPLLDVLDFSQLWSACKTSDDGLHLPEVVVDSMGGGRGGDKGKKRVEMCGRIAEEESLIRKIYESMRDLMKRSPSPCWNSSRVEIGT